jgi:hypothetical protein
VLIARMGAPDNSRQQTWTATLGEQQQVQLGLHSDAFADVSRDSCQPRGFSPMVQYFAAHTCCSARSALERGERLGSLADQKPV